MYEDEGGRSRTKPEGIKSKVERESHMRKYKNNDIKKLIINMGECQTSFSS